MAYFSLSLVVCLLLSFYSPVPLHFVINIYWLVALLLVGVWLMSGKINFLCQLLLGAAVALLLSTLYSQSLYRNDALLFDQQSTPEHEIAIEGQVANIQTPVNCREQRFCASQLLLQLKQVEQRPVENTLYPFYIQLRADIADLEVKKGDTLRAIVSVQRPLGYENQYGFNYAKWAFAQGIVAKAKPLQPIVINKRQTALSQRIYDALQQPFSGLNHPEYFYPLLLAERSLLSQTQKQQLQQQGLSHLFAISGLHIGILYLTCLWLLKLLLIGVTHQYKWRLVQAFALVVIWLYVLLIGLPIPATRAAILLSIWLLLAMTDRATSNTNTFALMLTFSLVLQPAGLLAASWWLSMSAVAGIFVFHQLMSELSQVKSLWQRLKYACYFQWFLGLWLLPASLYWFHGLSLSGFLLNLVCIPLFCLVLVPLLFVATLLFFLGAESLAKLVFVLLDKLFQALLGLVDSIALNMAWLDLSPALLIFALWLLFVALVLRQLSTVLATIASVLVIVLPLSSSLTWPLGKLSLQVFDVGQGTSVLLYRNGKGVLYDLGPVFISGSSATKAVVKPNLLGLGLLSLDRVIISHWDSDHYGDIEQLTAFIGEDTWFGCPAAKIHWQGVRIEPIWPRASHLVSQLPSQSDNDASCVLKLYDTITDQSALLTGDISRKVELTLVAQHHQGKINLNVDVLFSPHHGSKFSSSYPFLKAVAPKIVIHNAGVHNRFNFPTAEVRKRVNHIGAEQYATRHLGQLQLDFALETKQLQVLPWLKSSSAFWKKQNPFSFQVEIR